MMRSLPISKGILVGRLLISSTRKPTPSPTVDIGTLGDVPFGIRNFEL